MNRPRTRPLVAGIAALAGLGTTLTGCASGASFDAVSVSGPVTLQYWTWFPAQATLQKSIDAFEAANPKIKVQLHELTSSDYQKQMPLALDGGQKLDLVAVQASAMAQQVRHQLTPLDTLNLSADWRSQVNSAVMTQAEKIVADNGDYFIPMGQLGSAVMFYNKDLLDRAGVAGPPTTMAELKDAVARVKASSPDNIPVVYDGAEGGWFQDELVQTLVAQNDPHFFDTIRYRQGSWNTPSYVKGLTEYKNLFHDGTLSKNVLELDYAQAMQDFTSGKSAFLFQGTWEAGLLSRTYRATSKININEVGLAAVPLVDGGTPTLRTFIEAGLAVPKNAVHPKEAAKLLAFLTFGNGVEPWASDLGLVPSKVGYARPDDVLADKSAQDGYNTLAKLILHPASDRNNISAFSTIVGSEITKVLNGEDPASAARNLQDQFASRHYTQ